MSDIFEMLPKEIKINEVGPREGFQNEKMILPTETKIALINEMMETGIAQIQIGSFSHPKVVPQHADIIEVCRGIDRPRNVKIAVQIPNVKGAQRAMDVDVDEWDFMLSVSDSHSMANANCTTFEALARMKDMLAMAKEKGVSVHGGMGTSLGCPFEGDIPLSRIFAVIDEYLKMGITHLGLSDTAGMADPKKVYHTMKSVMEHYPEADFKIHIHNTRGLGIANILSAMLAGCSVIDTSMGGMGGCPFSPGASGNVPTEDVVHLLDLLGIHTGVDAKKSAAIARKLEQIFGHTWGSHIAKAGTSDELHDIVMARKAKSKA